MTEPNADQDPEDARKVLTPPPFIGRREPELEPEPQIPGLETDPDL